MNTSPEARVIASFTFIVALYFGLSGGVEQVVSQSSLVPDGLSLDRLLPTLLPFGATALAYVSARSAQAEWARALGGAAVMLGLFACLGGVLYLVR